MRTGDQIRDTPSRRAASRRRAAAFLLAAAASVPALAAPRNGDVDAGGSLDIADVVYILRHLFLAGPAPPPNSVRRGLPTSGVETCLDTDGSIDCPLPGEPFHGQDASYPGLPHDFEVVTPDPQDASTWYTIDHATALLWQYDHPRQRMTWPEALAHVNGLELGGFTGWRLPNAFELASIVDFDPGKPALDPGAFGLVLDDPRYGTFWSSTTVPVGGSEAYVVSFTDRAMYFSPKDPGYKPDHVRAVRSSTAAAANGDINGDGALDVSDAVRLILFLFAGGSPPVPLRHGEGLPVTVHCVEPKVPGAAECLFQGGSDEVGLPREFEVIRPDPADSATWYTVDRATGLAWQHDEALRLMSWEEALAYCEASELGGFDDWRLPSVRELQSIVNHGYMYPALDTARFGSKSYALEGRDHWGFWSATPGFGLLQDLGLITASSIHPGITNWVRAVRTVAASPGE